MLEAAAFRDHAIRLPPQLLVDDGMGSKYMTGALWLNAAAW